LEQSGVWKVCLERGTNTHHFLCQDSFGTIYDVIADKISEDLLRKRSAYASQAEQGGTWQQIGQWLLHKGAEPTTPPAGPIEFISPP
jgi:hypothetical protein